MWPPMADAAGFGVSLLALAVAAAGAWLPWAAYRAWRGPWRRAALAPLLFGLLWLVWMIARAAANPGDGANWQLQIFAWAMLTLVYMACAFTIKSILDKARR